MSTPIFVLGCHRSGTSAVSGLLRKACGVSMGELMPATEDNPLGYFEAQAVVDAHRGILAQVERDWTCPPSSFDPAVLDLSALQEQIATHQQLPTPWAMKDPTSMFLLPAWGHLGVNAVRLVAVARPPGDTISSIVKRDGFREDRAEAIVDAYLRRLVQIAEQVPLPVIQFPGDEEPLTAQVRTLAKSLELPWDEAAAQEFFREDLVRNRSTLRSSSPTFDRLLEKAARPTRVPTTDLGSLELDSEPQWALETHLGLRHAVQRNQLWALATFRAFEDPEVVEFLLDGARDGGRRPRRLRVHQLVLPTPEAAGAALLDSGRRPHGVVAHALLADRPDAEVDFFFRSIYIGTHPLAELVIDVPNPADEGVLHSTPAPPDQPHPTKVEEIATACGWDLLQSQRVSPAREGMVFRKRVPTDHELVPMTTELVSRAHRISALDARLQALESTLESTRQAGRSGERFPAAEERARAAEERARQAEERARASQGREAHTKQQLQRVLNRRSVRASLWFARPFRPLFRTVRSWRR